VSGPPGASDDSTVTGGPVTAPSRRRTSEQPTVADRATRPPSTSAGNARRTLERFAFPLGAFALSRVVCLFAGVLGTFVRPSVKLSEWFTGWDGAFYATVVRDGYPSVIPYADGQMLPNNIAFFPGYPLLGKAFSILPFSTEISLLVAALVAGAVATVLLWITAEQLWDRKVADRATLLFVFSPGAYVLSWAYSEALLLALSIGCLLALVRRRWFIAGLLAAGATATRPNAVVIVLCCLVAAVPVARRERTWKPLVAPVLAPLGIALYFGYLWARTGVVDAWFKVEHDIWRSKIDYGARLYDFLDRFVHHPIRDSSDMLVGVTTILAIAGLVVMFTSRRLPVTYKLFGLGMLLLPVLSAELLMRPRWLFTAFPIVLGVADRAGDRWTHVIVAMSAGAMALLVVYYGYFGGTGIVSP
jgi:hypothetical protein